MPSRSLLAADAELFHAGLRRAKGQVLRAQNRWEQAIPLVEAELRDACGTRMRLVVGSGVETGTRRHTDLAPGDPVVISFPWCGECGPCRAARMSRICQYCRSLVSFQREFVDRAILSLKHAGVPSFLIE